MKYLTCYFEHNPSVVLKKVICEEEVISSIEKNKHVDI